MRMTAAILFSVFIYLSCSSLFSEERESPPPLEVAKNHQVAIPRSAFGKEYLLSTSVIPQAGQNTSHARAGRIVTFELFHDGVDLYESPKGIVISNDLPAKRLLTTFPIVKKNDQSVIIDFNAGMDRVLVSAWYSQDGELDEALVSAMDVPRSRVFSVERKGPRLLVRQAAQGRVQSTVPTESRLEIRYYLSPYLPGDYTAIEHRESERKRVRFFETYGQREAVTGRLSMPVMRFDPEKPIKFYYSANTPPDYVTAVRDGILYWNRAFGKEVVTAEQAPEGVTAPVPDFNLVQWVDYDHARSAYADAIPDPRTGQTMHGQAYVTSVFAMGNIQRARALLRRLRATADGETEQPGLTAFPSIPLGGLFIESPCSCQSDPQDFAWEMAVGIQKLIDMGNVDDRRILQASQDMVRHVTAHEVGHVLGLRHNFAGSLSTQVSKQELDDWLRTYMTSDEVPDLDGRITSNSVMEYVDNASRIHFGYQLRTSNTVLPYDQAAIRWGYLSEEMPESEELIFATDDDAGTYGDVVTRDYGRDPVITSYEAIGDIFKLLPSMIVERYILAKAPEDPRDAVPLEEVVLQPSAYVSQVTGSYRSLLQWFNARTRSLRIENRFDFVGELNRSERLNAHWDYLNDQLKRLGGVDRAAFGFLPVEMSLEMGEIEGDIQLIPSFEAAAMTAEIDRLLDSEPFQEFVGLDGNKYRFTDDEKKLIRERSEQLFSQMEKELVKALLPILGSAKRDLGVEALEKVSEDDVVAKLEKRIVDLAEAVIMKKDPSQRRKGTLNKAHVEVVEFYYDLETRSAAARMLADDAGSFSQWCSDARTKLNEQLEKEVNDSLNISQLKEFKTSQLSRPLRQWYLDQQSVLRLLPASRDSRSE